MTAQQIREHCKLCLRYNDKGYCMAFNVLQNPCTGFIDDPLEFKRRQKEMRAYYETNADYANKLALEARCGVKNLN